MIVNEVYVGRVKEIDDIFTEFKKLRQDYIMLNMWKNNKQTAKIEKMIEDFFGFRAFSLSIEIDSIPNAYTYPVSSVIDINPTDFIETTSKGYRYKKGARASAMSVITTGVFKNKNITDEECFAIFLHEIGHSFVHRSPMIDAQQDVYVSTLIMQIIMQIILSVLTLNPFRTIDAMTTFLASSTFYKLITTKFNQTVKKIPVLRALNLTFDMACGVIKSILNRTIYGLTTITGFRWLMAKLSSSEYNNIISKQEKITGKTNAYGRSMERLSDDFATMYGFGPALSTGLLKIENVDNQGLFMKFTHHMPLIGKLFSNTDSIVQELNGLYGVHPASADRILSVLEGMKKDIQIDKKMPEKIKAELRANIKEQERIIQEIKKESNEALKNQNAYLQALTVLGISNGSGEDFMEKKFTDRNELQKFYNSRKQRKLESVMEEIELDSYYYE